jgi:hypothetical protein
LAKLFCGKNGWQGQDGRKHLPKGVQGAPAVSTKLLRAWIQKKRQKPSNTWQRVREEEDVKGGPVHAEANGADLLHAGEATTHITRRQKV